MPYEIAQSHSDWSYLTSLRAKKQFINSSNRLSICDSLCAKNHWDSELHWARCRLSRMAPGQPCRSFILCDSCIAVIQYFRWTKYTEKTCEPWCLNDEFCHEAFIRIEMLVADSCEWQAETATLKQSENLHTKKTSAHKVYIGTWTILGRPCPPVFLPPGTRR